MHGVKLHRPCQETNVDGKIDINFLDILAIEVPRIRQEPVIIFHRLSYKHTLSAVLVHSFSESGLH